jgi:hypothetical protein
MRNSQDVPKPLVPRLRCAIYTRKSTEEGLDQEFNSLDAVHSESTARRMDRDAPNAMMMAVSLEPTWTVRL